MEARFPREAERLLLLAFFFRFSSLEESLEAEPVRVASGTVASVAGASVSPSLGETSVLFFGAVLSLAAVAASVEGLPLVCVSNRTAAISERQLICLARRRRIAQKW